MGKREIARAFNLKGQDRIKLKEVLREMGERGIIERGRRKNLGSKVNLPPVLAVQVSSDLTPDGELLLTPLDILDATAPIHLLDEDAHRTKPGDSLLVRVKYHS